MRKFEFIKDINLFKLRNIPCVGNFENGSFIGLNEKGLNLINYIKENNTLPESMDAEEEMLVAALDKGEYFKKNTNTSALKSCYIHVTNRCNLNCIGCYSFDCTRNTIDDLSLDDLKDIMNQLKEAGVENVTISGGEPLIRRDIVDILKYAKEECKFEVINLISNGTIQREDIYLEIKKYINDFAISIDGYDEVHSKFIRDDGIFPTVVGTIKKLKRLGLNVAILPTLHNKNIDNMVNYCDLAKRLGVSISFSLMTCSTDLQEFIPTEEQLIKMSSYFDGSSDYFSMDKKELCDYSVVARKNCGAGENIISVGADGNIYPCHMMHSEKTVMGNIKNTPLKEILANSVPLPKVEDMHKCKECEYKDICGGGCRARAFLVKDNLNEPDPYCVMYENFYKSFLDKIEEASLS